jgi:VIT1/CCC1 family predicted Fe2+/Mn2+ transporter
MSDHSPGFHIELHNNAANSKLNWLRAAVLGANDGIVSVAAVVVGVAGATSENGFILTAGIAAIVGGALSMAVGEYVSVSTQRDTERALLAKERFELDNYPEQELEELAAIYKQKGLSDATAHVVARELTQNDAFAAHVDAELGIDPNDLTNPWHAAYASAGAFLSGGIIPLIAVIVAPEPVRIFSIFGGVLVALAVTGGLSAYVGGAHKTTAVIRNIVGGALAMGITFGIGKLFGVVGL